MAKLKAGLIATGFMPKDMDPFEALEKLAAMGYKGYEVVMMAQGRDMATGKAKYTEEQALAKLREVGMEPLTAFMMAGPDGEYDVKAIAEQAHRLGVDRATSMVSTVAQYRFGRLDEPLAYDEAMAEVERLERAAVALKKEGVKVAFHNHDEEFLQCYKGVPYYYLMAAYSDELKFELDTGWCTYAGFDPVQVMTQLGDRLCAVHIKDFQDGGVEQVRPKRTIVMPRFTTPGTGHLNLKGVLQKALDMGIDYAIIEQDFMYNLDPLATAQAGYYNMKETGLVE
ncbi:MAG: sugar phosphate isomerase/epimerase [Lachnospiraceae bacterium]|nr:sugar phosphate isomerase/epimerase [Lachnospiraceae bacterium]